MYSVINQFIELCVGVERQIMCQDDCEVMWKDKSHVSR